MKLGDLLDRLKLPLDLPPTWRERDILDIVHDSRKVKPGSLFVAVRGSQSDGHQFIPQAIKRGAAAVVAEAGGVVAEAGDTPVIRIPDSRKMLAHIADVFYGHPSGKLKLIGITGTKGKTTTSYLVRSIIEAAGHQSGLIGTIDYRVGSAIYPAPNTTPESLELQQLLDAMTKTGSGYCVMEVSSHALALGRTDRCQFHTAVFTNLAQDHLDFHKDMESYFQAKQLLFTGLAQNSAAVVNLDDAMSREIIGRTKAAVHTYGMSADADVHPDGAINHGIGRLSFAVEILHEKIAVESSLMGLHNVYNILAAIAAGRSLGFSNDVIAAGIRNMKAVPGRMEMVNEGQSYGVVVDYAHTEASLMHLLRAVRETAPARIITVFGCGGDRDRAKRPRMGKVAMEGSTITIVTTDNPRSEDPKDIIAEIESGMAGGVRLAWMRTQPRTIPEEKSYYVIPDRAEAIHAAIGLAEAGDIVVLAGKGHEDYQIIGTNKMHFDDREIAREEIRKRRMMEVR